MTLCGVATLGAPDRVAAGSSAPGGTAQEPETPGGTETAPAVPPPDFPAEIELDWQAPPHCPDADALRLRIEQLMGAPPRGEGTVVVVGRVEPTEGGLKLALSTDFRGRVERRELFGPTCDELAEATAIVLAVALEPELASSLPVTAPTAQPETAQTEPETVPEPDSRLGPAAAPISNPDPDPAEVDRLPPSTPPTVAPPRGDPSAIPSATSRPQTRIRVGAAGEFGTLPGLTGGPRLALGLAWPRARLEVHGGYLAPRLDASEGRGVLYQAGMAGVRGCGRFMFGRVELPVCGGVEGGAVRAATRGFAPARTRHGPRWGPLASVGIAARFRRIGLWSAVEALVPIQRGEFVIAGEVGFRGIPLSSRLVFGLEFIIP